MLVIEAKGLTKTYAGAFGRGALDALRGVDLGVERGLAFGLIGPNGAGKTTFIKTLLGVVRPTSGSVRVLGGDPSDPAVRAQLGYLPEHLHLPASLTPLQFLASVARLKRVAASERTLRPLLERVGLSSAFGRRIGGFSKGMRQRLGLAAALVGAPDLLILDEPTDGIDPLGRRDVRRILAEELERGATVFLNSHLLAETERICTRAGILFRGQVVREGTLDELRRGETRYRARFANVEAGFMQSLGFKESEGRFHLDAQTPEALNEALDRARAAGGLLLELVAETQDLEDVLATAVGGAA